MKYHYVWLLWSSAFLVPWIALYAVAKARRREMLSVSLATSLLGLSEPVFVPSYWNPPSLFELAQRTGFDIESFIFCFAIGGIGSILYSTVTKRNVHPVPHGERHSGRHRFHRLALTAPFIVFPLAYLLPWNPIYAAIAALAAGGAAGVLCRPDLVRNSLVGGTLFFGLYAAFMLLLVVFAPGYIEAVWNLAALSGVLAGGIPLEELAFGFAFGTYWAALYEHFTWMRSTAAGAGAKQISFGGQHG